MNRVAEPSTELVARIKEAGNGRELQTASSG